MIRYEELSKYIIMRCNLKEKEITNMKLQKMIFYCQAYYMAKYKEKLIDNEFEAWRHGAVLAPLYRDYCSYRNENIHIFDTRQYYNSREEFGVYLTNFLDRIIDKFSKFSAIELRRINHDEEPWKIARTGYAYNENCNEIISDTSIYRYYSEIIEKKGVNNMERKKISIKDKRMLLAKKRLAERKLFEITEDNKDEYFKYICNELEQGSESIRRVMEVNAI